MTNRPREHDPLAMAPSWIEAERQRRESREVLLSVWRDEPYGTTTIEASVGTEHVRMRLDDLAVTRMYADTINDLLLRFAQQAAPRLAVAAEEIMVAFANMGMVAQDAARQLSVSFAPLRTDPAQPQHLPPGRVRKAEADQRAAELLRSVLTAEQWESWRHQGNFELRSQNGNLYRIYRGDVNNVRLVEEGIEVSKLCAGPDRYSSVGYLPLDDFIAGQVLALKHREAEFLAEANVSPLTCRCPDCRAERDRQRAAHAEAEGFRPMGTMSDEGIRGMSPDVEVVDEVREFGRFESAIRSEMVMTPVAPASLLRGFSVT